jgi:hypothetical protein
MVLMPFSVILGDETTFFPPFRPNDEQRTVSGPDVTRKYDDMPLSVVCAVSPSFTSLILTHFGPRVIVSVV